MSEPFKHFCGFVSKSDFFVSAILRALTGDCAEHSYKSGVFNAVHYVGGKGFGDVDKLGCLVGVEVSVKVGALADGCSCRLDGVVEEVGALIVCEVVGFCDFAREVVAKDLFEVLSVVGVGARYIGESEGFHRGDVLSSFGTYIIPYSRAVVNRFFEKNKKIFFKKRLDF